MARYLYSLLFYLAQPLIWGRLLWRARRQPDYSRHIAERYGFYRQGATRQLIWLHTVSVGETRAAEPLIKALLDAYPDHTLLLTHMTPTGRATGGELMGKHGPRLTQAYLPYDLPGACARFLDHFAPRLGLLMETELWPNLIAAANRRKIPLALINARLSARSQRGYTRIAPLIRPALAGLSTVAAQTPGDAQRLAAIGARDAQVFGNLKFDVTPAREKLSLGEHWREELGERPIWLAASTREGEETLILDAFARLDRPDILLLLVPRHPQRFAEVAGMLEQRKLSFIQRSTGDLPTPATRVWLGDSMGEMPAYFRVANVALIGGTLLPFGGQNLIEAAACGCPVLVGPHTFNFLQATDDAIASGAAVRIENADQAAREATRLIDEHNTLKSMRDAAIRFSQAHRGATEKTLALIREITASRTAD